MLDLSITNAALSAMAGFASVASPCVLPVVPIIMTGSSDDHRLRPILIILGLSIAFILMGIVSVLFGALIAGKMQYAEKGVGIIIVVFGLLMMVDVNFFKKLMFLSSSQLQSTGVWSGFLMGFSLGIVWIPCIGPMLSSVLGMVALQGKLLPGIVLLVFYSLGFSIPMLIAGYSSQYFRQKVGIIKSHPKAVRWINGGFLIIFGLYIYFFGMLGFSFFGIGVL